jgi:hypothetical protein
VTYRLIKHSPGLTGRSGSQGRRWARAGWLRGGHRNRRGNRAAGAAAGARAVARLGTRLHGRNGHACGRRGRAAGPARGGRAPRAAAKCDPAASEAGENGRGSPAAAGRGGARGPHRPGPRAGWGRGALNSQSCGRGGGAGPAAARGGARRRPSGRHRPTRGAGQSPARPPRPRLPPTRRNRFDRSLPSVCGAAEAGARALVCRRGPAHAAAKNDGLPARPRRARSQLPPQRPERRRHGQRVQRCRQSRALLLAERQGAERRAAGGRERRISAFRHDR